MKSLWNWDICPLPSLEGRHDGRQILLEISVLGSRNPTDLTHFNYMALLDTGATASWISARVVADLALASVGKGPVAVATEIRQVSAYIFRLGMIEDRHNPAALPFVFAETRGFVMPQRANFDVILGMDVLRETDFQMARGGRWNLTFG